MSTVSVPALRRPERLLLEVSQVRRELERFESVEELQEGLSRLAAVDAYAKAKGAREITDRAAETRIWIERRAGELALAQGLNTRQMRAQYEVSAQVAWRWIAFASVPEEDLEAIVDATRSRRELTVQGVLRQVLAIEEPTSKPGITRLVTGQFRLRWRAGGMEHSALETGSLKTAAGRLARVRKSNVGPAATNPGLASAYGSVRRALSLLDQSLDELPADSRAQAETAIARLHEAEDAIGEARRLWV